MGMEIPCAGCGEHGFRIKVVSAKEMKAHLAVEESLKKKQYARGFSDAQAEQGGLHD